MTTASSPPMATSATCRRIPARTSSASTSSTTSRPTTRSSRTAASRSPPSRRPPARRRPSTSPPTLIARARPSPGTWPRQPRFRRSKTSPGHVLRDHAGRDPEAFAHPRSIDMHLVDAQQARRVLDRVVGYTLSPLLWRKVRGGLSAGRVQSVAVRLVVDREREIAQIRCPRVLDSRGAARDRRGRPLHGQPLHHRRQEGRGRGRRVAQPSTRRPSRRRDPRDRVDRPANHASQPRAAVHDQHAPAGGQSQARLQPAPDDARGAAALRGPRDVGGPGRPHHLYANRLDGAWRAWP